MICYAALCYAKLCYAMLCYAALCYAMLCYGNAAGTAGRGTAGRGLGEPRDGCWGNRPGRFTLPGFFKHTSKNPLRQSLGREQIQNQCFSYQHGLFCRRRCELRASNGTRRTSRADVDPGPPILIIKKQTQSFSCSFQHSLSCRRRCEVRGRNGTRRTSRADV